MSLFGPSRKVSLRPAADPLSRFKRGIHSDVRRSYHRRHRRERRRADGRRRAAAVSGSGRVRLRRPQAGGEKIYYFLSIG